MAYINFKEEKKVLYEQIQNRKKNNEKIYNSAIRKKSVKINYELCLKYSYKNISEMQIGKKGIYNEEDFSKIENKDIICCEFRKCKFENIKFESCNFIACKFIECEFINGGVIFENCTFIKDDSEESPSLNKKDNVGCEFEKCSMYIKLLNSDLSYCIFEECKFRTCAFELSNMSNVIFSECEIDDVEVIDCDFSGFKTLNTYIKDLTFDDTYMTIFDQKTFFDKIDPRVKDRPEYEGIYMTYKILSEKFKENSLESSFGEYYYLAKCTQRKCIKFVAKVNSYIYWLTCGYGERPLMCILTSIVIMIIFSFIYLAIGIDLDGEIIRYGINNITSWKLGKFILDFNEAMNLSIGTFGGVGVTNSKPLEFAYIVADVEMIIGITMMGVGIGTLTRKVVR